MKLAAIDGFEVEYELRGSGEPVVVIHWGVSARWAEPLLAEPILAERYRVLRYHRVGFGGSSRVEGPIGMADHAEHCRLLLRELGIERAHVVGHSSSALIALQLALDAQTRCRLGALDAARPAPQRMGGLRSRWRQRNRPVARATPPAQWTWARGSSAELPRPLDRRAARPFRGDPRLRGHILRPGAAGCAAVVVRRDRCAPDRTTRPCRPRREQRSDIP